jgi:hypothetical protein
MREVPDTVEAAIAKTFQGGSFSMHSKDYSNYTNVIPADSGSASVLSELVVDYPVLHSPHGELGQQYSAIGNRTMHGWID